MEYNITEIRNIAYPAAIGILYFISIISCGLQRRGYEVLKTIRGRVNTLERDIQQHRAEHAQIPRFQPIYSIPFPNPSATAPQIPSEPITHRYEENTISGQYKIV
jgi:hypothetical protein